MQIDIQHLVVKRILAHTRHPFIGYHGVLTLFPLPIHFGNKRKTMFHTPVLQDVGRTVNILHMQESLMHRLLESLPMIIFIRHPRGIHMPQHPLRSHLVESAPAPGFSLLVCDDLKLETMPQLMRRRVEFLILKPVRSCPKGTNLVVVCPAVSRTFQRIHNHDHHSVLLTLRARLDKLQRIAETTVEPLQPFFQVFQIDTHIFPLQFGRVGQIITEAFLPKYSQVVSTLHPPVGIIVVLAPPILSGKFLRLVDGFSLRQFILLARRERQGKHGDSSQEGHYSFLSHLFFFLYLIA